MMDHANALALVPAYVDQELSLSEALAFERHLADCLECQGQVAEQERVSVLLRSAELSAAAPPELLNRIKSSLPVAQYEPSPNPSVNPPLNRTSEQTINEARHDPARQNNPRSGNRSRLWFPIGSLLVSGLALACSGMLYLSVPTAEQRLGNQVVDNNIRSLEFNHLSDVVSTDQHTVKPWFDGKLDFAPPVIDLASQGYPLTGGRLDYLAGRRVAVLIYRYKLHPVSLFVWPGREGPAAPQIRVQQGYHLAHWSTGGMDYYAITDAGEPELHGFITGIRQRTGG